MSRLQLAFHVVQVLLLVVVAGLGAELVLRPDPPFTFKVDHGKCACTFDDDYDFAADRDRIRATVCAGR